MSINDEILLLIEQTRISIALHREIAKVLEVDISLVAYSDIEKVFIDENDVFINTKINTNYLKKIKNDINSCFSNLPFRNHDNTYAFTREKNKHHYRDNFLDSYKNFSNFFENLKFNIDFFKKTSFMSKNIVGVGANGSGKTSLTSKFKETMGNDGIVVSAQRILRIPEFQNIPVFTKTLAELRSSQAQDKTYKTEQSYNFANAEFGVLLQNLIANDIQENKKYVDGAKKASISGLQISAPELTNIEKAFSIWMDLIEHREIYLKDGINIFVTTGEGVEYPAIKMSEGEKVILFLIAQVIQAPTGGFVVIDEPEMHLHKAILNKLWDRLEKERGDCIFIYLTHDLDFAIGRSLSKKLWIKSYDYPNKWEIFDIPESVLPEGLIMHLLGSRKKILLCEGKEQSMDIKLYTAIFPDYSVVPVDGCVNVINYVRSFNRISEKYIEAFGIIDSDFRSEEEVESLRKDNIYTINVAEIENVFLDASFLKLIAKQLLVEDLDSVECIKKKVLEKLNQDLEGQVSEYLISKINFHFTSSQVSKGRTKEDVSLKYREFISTINIEEWYTKRRNELCETISMADYQKAIKVFNNKGLKQIVHQQFGVNDFFERSLKYLESSKDAKDAILGYFPLELL